jgi:hypothetical protein
VAVLSFPRHLENATPVRPYRSWPWRTWGSDRHPPGPPTHIAPSYLISRSSLVSRWMPSPFHRSPTTARLEHGNGFDLAQPLLARPLPFYPRVRSPFFSPIGKDSKLGKGRTDSICGACLMFFGDPKDTMVQTREGTLTIIYYKDLGLKYEVYAIVVIFPIN